MLLRLSNFRLLFGRVDIVQENLGSRNDPPLDLHENLKAGVEEGRGARLQRDVNHICDSTMSGHSDFGAAVKAP